MGRGESVWRGGVITGEGERRGRMGGHLRALAFAKMCLVSLCSDFPQYLKGACHSLGVSS